jgi:hypothetical protein
MCHKHGSTKIEIQGRKVKVDSCLNQLILWLNNTGVKTFMCCCGHGKYRPTIIYQKGGSLIEFYSNSLVLTKHPYVKDSEGVFFIPENHLLQII